MGKQNLLLVFVFVSVHQLLSFVLVGARALPPVSYLSPLSSSSFASPPWSSPISSSMAAFSPGPIESIAGAKMDKYSKRLVLAVIIASASAGMFMLSVVALWIYHHKISNKACRKIGKGFAPNQPKGGFNTMKMNGSKRPMSVDFKQLETATGNFEEGNKLSNGEFGCIYKAKFDDDRYFAVKKIKGGKHDAEKEFENEVNLLNKIQHPNIITLLGYCTNEDTRYIVYELMEKGSLETQLHGPSRGAGLTWPIRMKIALDVARGLEYLHEHCRPAVIYRDLKSANILLDSNFNAKLGHFGVAVTEGYQSKNDVKLPDTWVCVAPEYASDGKLSDKSDVYGFGVVLLELLLGRKAVENSSTSECESIVKWAMPQLTDRSKLPGMADPVIRDTMDLKHLYQVAAVAVLCVQEEPSYRPLITDVLHSLIPLVPVELGGTLRPQSN